MKNGNSKHTPFLPDKFNSSTPIIGSQSHLLTNLMDDSHVWYQLEEDHAVNFKLVKLMKQCGFCFLKL